MKTSQLLTILAFLLAATFTHAQTIVPPGAVEGRWTIDKSPYTIDGAIYVRPGSTLFIEPGVEVIFKTRDRMHIYGCFKARGTEKQPIHFTAADKITGWGGIWFTQTSPRTDTSKLVYCHFEYGNAKGDSPYNSGGAIGVRELDKLLIRHCTFEYNKALHYSTLSPTGGAIALWKSNIRISHCIFRYNIADFGGAISINDCSKPIIDNCLFYSNNVSSYGGAIEVYDHSNPSFVSCTFADNRTVYSGGAFDICLSSSAYLLNCILWYNMAGMSGNQVNIRSGESYVKMFYCNLEGGMEGISGFPFIATFKEMLNAYPIFQFTKDGPYCLSPYSPCVETGSIDCKYFPEGWCCPCNDLANTNRIWQQQIDMGCFEYHSASPPDEDENALPKLFNVVVFPSPVKNLATIKYELNETKAVKLTVYDIQGKIVSSLPMEEKTAGVHQIIWNAQSLPNGIYIYKLRTGNEWSSGQLILAK